MISTANKASAISGKLQLATLRKPTLEQLRAIVLDVDALRLDLVRLGVQMATEESEKP